MDIYIYICIYIYRKKSTRGSGHRTKMEIPSPPLKGLPARVWATSPPRSACQIAFPLGFGPLFALIASKTDHFGPKTANLGPDPLPRPSTYSQEPPS